MQTALDDLSGQYLEERQSEELTPADMILREQADTGKVEPGKKSFALSPPTTMLGKVKAVAKDVAVGAVEAPLQVVGGIMDAGKEIGLSIEGLMDMANLPVFLQVTNEKGEIDIDLLSKKELDDLRIKGHKPMMEGAIPEKGKTVTGGLVRGVSQFLAGFLPVSKGMQAVGATGKLVKTLGPAAGKMVAGMAAGAVADATVFDAHEDRLSNLIQKYPNLQNPVTEFLAADPSDSEAMGKFKNAAEGLVGGVLADGLFAALRGVRASRVKKLELKKASDEAAQIDQFANLKEEPTDIDLQKLKAEAKKKEPLFQVGSKKAGKERALNINETKLNTTDDVKALIEGVGKKYADDINEARREIITHKETKKLADELGMSVDDLLERRRGEAFNAEQAVAARRILVASGEGLIKFAQSARAGGEEALVQFRRAMSQHEAIQKQVSGMTAEAGRALQSFRMPVSAGKLRQGELTALIDASGGIKQSQQIAEMMLTMKDSKAINKFVQGASKATTKDMLYEAWINGLLSSPATHMVNIIGNSLTAFTAIGERKIASKIGQALDVQNIPKGEAAQLLYGMINGARDGMQSAWQVLKTGDPVDALTKQEHAGYRAITAENLNLSGTPGRFADFVGNAVRVSSRLLTAGDEFFTSVAYRMELQGQAFRQGTQEGLEGEALSVRMADIIDNPPDNIKMDAEYFKKYQTFTKPLGEAGQHLQKFTQFFPPARVVMPFIRTPVNIMKYAGERTPLAFMSDTVKAELNAGGARRDLALAKIATGSMIMAVTADLSMSGKITGGGPRDRQLKQMKYNTGWQPYSVKVGDKYYSYNRLDPIGALMGLASDVTEIIGQTEDDVDAMDLGVAATLAIVKNVTSKTYLRGLSEFFEAIGSTSELPGAKNTRMRKYLERLGSSMMPFSSLIAGVERQVDPELRAANNLIEKIQSRIPGWSKDLPPRRNIFGEPVVLEGGIGPDIMSPIYESTIKDDPVVNEIVAQQTRLRMPMKTIDGVELDTKEYDKYILFMSGKNNKYVDNKPLKMALKELFHSSEYTNGTDGTDGSKSLLIKTQIQVYQQTAKQMMRDTSEQLLQDIQAKRAEKYRKLGVEI